MSINRNGLTGLRSVTSHIQEKVFGRPVKRSDAKRSEDSTTSKPVAQQNSQRPDWYQATHKSDS